jgi:hypothetical protein
MRVKSLGQICGSKGKHQGSAEARVFFALSSSWFSIGQRVQFAPHARADSGMAWKLFASCVLRVSLRPNLEWRLRTSSPCNRTMKNIGTIGVAGCLLPACLLNSTRGPLGQESVRQRSRCKVWLTARSKGALRKRSGWPHPAADVPARQINLRTFPPAL